MPIEFPYRVKLSKYHGPVLVIYVWLHIKTKRGIYRAYEFLFDTGADYTTLPKYMTEVIGIDLTECPEEVMYGANNQPMLTYHAITKVRFDKKIFHLPCVFTESDNTPFLLGRIGFFEHYTITLDPKHQRIIFTK